MLLTSLSWRRKGKKKGTTHNIINASQAGAGSGSSKPVSPAKEQSIGGSKVVGGIHEGKIFCGVKNLTEIFTPLHPLKESV